MHESLTWQFIIDSGIFTDAELEFRDGFATDRGPLSAMAIVEDRVRFSWEWRAKRTLETYCWEMADPACCEAHINDVPTPMPCGRVAIALRQSERQRSTIILTPKTVVGHKRLTDADIATPWEMLIAQHPEAQYDEKLFERVMIGKMMNGLRAPDVAPGFPVGLPFVLRAHTLRQALGGLRHDHDKERFVEYYIEAAKGRPVRLTPR